MSIQLHTFLHDSTFSGVMFSRTTGQELALTTRYPNIDQTPEHRLHGLIDKAAISFWYIKPKGKQTAAYLFR